MRFEGRLKERLGKSKFFSKTFSAILQKIIETLSFKEYENEILKIKTPGRVDRLWLLLSGCMQFSENKILNNEEMIGDYSMFDEKEVLLSDDDTEIILNGYIASISLLTLGNILSSSHAFNDRKSILVNEKKEMVKIRLEDLIFIKNFGDGLFGPIYLVKNDETNKLFVLKCISKAVVCEKNLEKHVIVRFKKFLFHKLLKF